MSDSFTAHQVTNQQPPLNAVNWYRADLALRQGVAHFGAAWAEDALDAYGALAGWWSRWRCCCKPRR